MPDRHVFEDERDDDGSRRHSAAYLNSYGALVIEIHDLGPVVERAFGMSEYESTETFTTDQTARDCAKISVMISSPRSRNGSRTRLWTSRSTPRPWASAAARCGTASATEGSTITCTERSRCTLIGFVSRLTACATSRRRT